MKLHSVIAVCGTLVSQVTSAPSIPDPTTQISAPAQLLSPIDALQNLEDGLKGGQLSGEAFFKGVRQELQGLRPTNSPTSIPEALATLQNIFTNQKKSFTAVAEMVLRGLGPANIEDALASYNTGPNSPTNHNNHKPTSPVYPRVNKSDGKYTQTEQQLRQQIYIPPEFTYGEKPPVIFVPGTGARGFMNFDQNIAKLIRGQRYADPVYINPTGFELADAQINAENIAYAVNYISSISKHKKVTLITWSQGGLNAQWAVKYWPSARSKVSAIVANSPDYHGTTLANALCGFAQICPPSVLQQEYDSTYVAALRSSGGASAYVPTTNIYSGFADEIVEPQQGSGASGFLQNARNIGVTNVQLQEVCGSKTPGGGFFTHEGVLYSSLANALVVDVLQHGGAGNLKRVNVNQVCSTAVAPGLNLDDVLQTESLIPFAGFQLVAYPNKLAKEPPLKAYAR